MNEPNYSRRGRIAVALFVAVALAAIVVTMLTAKADAAQQLEPSHRAQCDEAWQAPRSAGAEQCRDWGWTVKARMVLDPTNRVHALIGLEPCVYEDSENCYWRARCQGISPAGNDFVRLNHRTWYVSFGRYECRA
jgi:hypothetical protein